MALTKQEVFDKVATHLLTQMEQSKSDKARAYGSEAPGCAYRGDGGKMCAVGCLIPDEMYDTSMEGKVAYDVYYNFEGVKELFDQTEPYAITKLLSTLQNLHDCREPPEWKDNLSQVALENSLDSSVLDKFKFEEV